VKTDRRGERVVPSRKRRDLAVVRGTAEFLRINIVLPALGAIVTHAHIVLISLRHGSDSRHLTNLKAASVTVGLDLGPGSRTSPLF